MTEKKAYLAIIRNMSGDVIASQWSKSIATAQNWAETYETTEVYMVSIFDEISDPPVLEYIINPMNI